jgi:intracellular sulfur oxidation DsrE/DsrF family protein
MKSGKPYGNAGSYNAGNMIEPYSQIHELPDAAGQPEKDLDYCLLYSITRQARNPGDPNPGLLHIALTINLFEWAGVPGKNIHFKGIVHGDAISIVLGEETHRKRFGRSNPDLDLIRKLRQHGVEILACGQTFITQGFQRRDLNPDITFALSALSVLSNCQLKGYALMTY